MNIVLLCLMVSIWRMCLCFSYYLGLCLSSSLSCISHQILMFCYSPLCVCSRARGRGFVSSLPVPNGSLWIWVWFKRPMTKCWRWGKTTVMGLKKQQQQLQVQPSQSMAHLETFIWIHLDLIPKYGIDFFLRAERSRFHCIQGYLWFIYLTHWLHRRITDLGFYVFFCVYY